MTSEIADNTIDLDETLEKDNIQLDYYDYTQFASDTDNPSDYGSGFEIRHTGVYLRLPDDTIWITLTKEEKKALIEHPTGNIKQPVLPFPFTPRQLKDFFKWAVQSGHDVPINEKVLLEVLKTKNASIVHSSSIPDIGMYQSDMTLGAATRQRNRAFAESPRDGYEMRKAVFDYWHETAQIIQQQHLQSNNRHLSLRRLAEKVKEKLNLPDSTETIRKRLSESNNKKPY